MRFWILFFPLIGSLFLSLRISPSCFAHYLSLQYADSVHLICRDLNFEYSRLICSSWVTFTSFTFSISIIFGTLSYFFGGVISQLFLQADQVTDSDIGSIFFDIMDLTKKAKIKDPNIYLLKSSTPQIFSYNGNGQSMLYISVGLLEVLTRDEVLAAASHEIAHLKNKDTLIKSISLGLKIASLFNFVGFAIDSMISKDREFIADLEGSKLTSPIALISALIKLSPFESEGMNDVVLGTLSFSMFSYKKKNWKLFKKHPSIDERIERLLTMV